MKALFLTIFSFLVFPALASTDAQTKIAIHARPTNAKIQAAISTLYKALHSEDESAKERHTTKARKLLDTRKVEHTYPGAIYVDGIKQFENGEDSPYDFRATCYKGEVTDAAHLINFALEQNFWSGDEDSIQSAEPNEKSIILSIHDGPNNENYTVEISVCKK